MFFGSIALATPAIISIVAIAFIGWFWGVKGLGPSSARELRYAAQL